MRRTGAAAALFLGLAAGGYGIASAAGGSASTASTTAAPQGYGAPPARDHAGHRPRGERTALTGDTLTKATAAAKAEVPGATVEGAFSHERGPATYVVVVKKADGSRAAVHLDGAFAVLGVRSGRARGPHGRGGHGRETPLTGATRAKVVAAAKAKVPGATVKRAETDAHGNAKYEVHMTKADGARVTVYVNAAFEAVEVESAPAGRRGPGGRP
jgi:uncharacterized membrane protein YkoI